MYKTGVSLNESFDWLWGRRTQLPKWGRLLWDRAEGVSYPSPLSAWSWSLLWWVEPAIKHTHKQSVFSEIIDYLDYSSQLIIRRAWGPIDGICHYIDYSIGILDGFYLSGWRKLDISIVTVLLDSSTAVLLTSIVTV